jgi:hypothetical protein
MSGEYNVGDVIEVARELVDSERSVILPWWHVLFKSMTCGRRLLNKLKRIKTAPHDDTQLVASTPTDT